MPATAQHLVAVLDKLSRQLRAGAMYSADYAALVELCSQVPGAFPARDSQPLIRALLSFAGTLVSAPWPNMPLRTSVQCAPGAQAMLAMCACQGAAACSQLASCLPLSRPQVAQLCRVLSLVLGPMCQTLCRIARQPAAAELVEDVASMQLITVCGLLTKAHNSGIMRRCAGQLAPADALLHWLGVVQSVLERCYQTKADLADADLSILVNYSSLLHNLFYAIPEYMAVRQHLTAAGAVSTQLLLHALRAGTAALHSPSHTHGVWHLLNESLLVLCRLSEGPAAAQRMLSSSLHSIAGPEPFPQLLGQLVAALPRRLPAHSAEDHGQHATCAAAAALLGGLLMSKAQSAPAGVPPIGVAGPAEWEALACLANLAPLLYRAASIAARRGNSDLQMECGQAAADALAALHDLFPRGTAFTIPGKLAQWCRLAHASWLLLATAAAVPELPEDQRPAAAGLTLSFNSSFVLTCTVCLPGAPGQGARGSSSSGQPDARFAAGGSWDATLRPLLQLSRQLCQAAHFLAQVDTASPVAAALLQASMPRVIISTFGAALGVLSQLDNFSTKRQQQALLLVASTHSALAALPPAASNLGVFGPACNEVLPWLSQPNRLIDDPALLRQLINLAALALDRWLQDPNCPAGADPPPKTSNVLRTALQLAATQPPLAATFLGHAALPALLERCAAEDGQAAGGIATQLRSLMDGLASQAASRSTGEQEPEQGSQSELLAALPSGDGSAVDSSCSAEQRLRQLASPAVLQQAAALAAALAAHAEPTQEQQAADALALARAVAAGPGCNNLACPDWTGEVARLKLCEACRTARYCSARCQREAWRAGGHRQCCAALAAERAGGRQG